MRRLAHSLGLWIALVLLAIVAVVSDTTERMLIDTSRAVSHTYEVIGTLGRLKSSVSGSEAAKRAYALTGDESALAAFSAEADGVRRHAAELRELTRDNPEQQARLDELMPLLERRLEALHTGITTLRESGFDAAQERATTREGARATAEIAARIDAMLAAEKRLLAARERLSARNATLARVVQLAAVFISVVLLLVAFRRLRSEVDLRMRSEESLSTTLQSIGDGVIATDVEGRVVRMNPVAEALSGWPLRDALGRPSSEVFRIIGETTRLPVEDPIARALRERRVVGLANHTLLVSRDGKETPIADSAAPIMATDGSISGAVLVFRDNSAERIAAEELERRVSERTEALRESQAQLLQSQKMEAVGQLAGGIAHDFNNLLSIVLSYSSMLANDLGPDSPHREDVEEIRKAGMRAAELTRQLLAFSRRQVLAPKVVDLNELIAGMEKMLRRLITENIRLETSYGEIVPVKVDPGQAEQVVMNLVVNARDAMPEGGVLRIETSSVEIGPDEARDRGVKVGRFTVLAVRDTGTGMSPGTQARIFEPFFTTKALGKGTGLGLSTVSGIVQQSAGAVTVESELGSGSTFRVFLPETKEPRENAAREPDRGQVEGKETILLVEDDPQVRALVARVLERAGFAVLQAGDGAEGLETFERAPKAVDLLFTDTVLPRMSGRELVERARALRADVKVLLMSGYTDDEVLRHGILDGLPFLQKPVVPETLLRVVREVLDGGRPRARR